MTFFQILKSVFCPRRPYHGRDQISNQTCYSDVEKKDASNKAQQFEIQIIGSVGLFKDEEEQVLQGAKQLVEMGREEDMKEAIITAAVMFRGLRFKETKVKEDGTVVVVLMETAQETFQ